jgi:hypothetical protein
MTNRAHIVQILRIVTVSLWISSSVFAATRSATSPAPLSSEWTSIPGNNLNAVVFSDFDHDQILDRAVLSSHGRNKSIALTLGRMSWKLLQFDSEVSDSGELVSKDIDGDGDVDLIWLTQLGPVKFVVWLNNGKGDFSMELPSDQDPGRLQSLLSGISKTRVARTSGDSIQTFVPQYRSLPGLPEQCAHHHLVLTDGFLPPARAPMHLRSRFSVNAERGPPLKNS